MSVDLIASKEKNTVALNSVWAAIFLTLSKFVIGIMTGSLGILSEALHSGLDLVAAIITYFSVKISDKPADKDHHFGHGKVENLSALIETLLLLITCAWIIYEAIERIFHGNYFIQVTYWSYIVVISSICIDIWRSRALKKAAIKYNSQALEADALHFSTDIWSSAVVLLGLICSNFGFYLADAIAALCVAVIVIFVSYKLGKKSIDVLLDKAPDGIIENINGIISKIPQVISVYSIKVRQSGADIFIEVVAEVEPDMSFQTSHDLIHLIEESIKLKIARAFVTVHLEPKN